MPLFAGVGDGVRHCCCLPGVSSAYRGRPQRGKRWVCGLPGHRVTGRQEDGRTSLPLPGCCSGTAAASGLS